MLKSFSVIRCSISVIASVSSIASPAMAEPVIVTGEPAPSASVSIGDLNVYSASGHARAVARVRSTASNLCLASAIEPLEMRLARTKCFRSAFSSGKQQLDALVAQSAGSATLATALTITER